MKSKVLDKIIMFVIGAAFCMLLITVVNPLKGIVPGQIFENIIQTEIPTVRQEDIKFVSDEDGKISPEEGSAIVIPGKKTALVRIDNAQSVTVDFSQNYCEVTVDKITFSFTSYTGANRGRKISRTLWEAADGSAKKVYAVLPIGEDRSVVGRATVTDMDEDQVKLIAKQLDSIMDTVSCVQNISIYLNGNQINNAGLISEYAIKFIDGSILVCSRNSDGLTKLYTDKVSEEWRNNEKIAKDSEGRVSYTTVRNDIRYTMLVNEGYDISTISSLISFAQVQEEAQDEE